MLATLQIYTCPRATKPSTDLGPHLPKASLVALAVGQRFLPGSSTQLRAGKGDCGAARGTRQD